MDEVQLMRSAENWRLVAAGVGLVALVLLVGSGTVFPWYFAVGAMVLLVGMLAIVYAKLQFSETLVVADPTSVSSESVASALRTAFPQVRVVKRRRGTGFTIKPRPGTLYDIRVEYPSSEPERIRLTCTPPARGELGSKPLRLRIREWGLVVNTLRDVFGTATP